MPCSIDMKLKLINIIYLNKKHNLKTISKKANISYSYCSLIIKELIEDKLITQEKKYCCYFTLTKKGLKISELYCQILDELLI